MATGVIAQTEFVPKLAKMLQETPEDVIKALEEFRSYSMSHDFSVLQEDELLLTVVVLWLDNSDEAFWYPLLGHR